jgi:hypothetical protein
MRSKTLVSVPIPKSYDVRKRYLVRRRFLRGGSEKRSTLESTSQSRRTIFEIHMFAHQPCSRCSGNGLSGLGSFLTRQPCSTTLLRTNTVSAVSRESDEDRKCRVNGRCILFDSHNNIVLECISAIRWRGNDAGQKRKRTGPSFI